MKELRRISEIEPAKVLTLDTEQLRMLEKMLFEDAKKAQSLTALIRRELKKRRRVSPCVDA
jgi:hypothetical protein